MPWAYALHEIIFVRFLKKARLDIAGLLKQAEEFPKKTLNGCKTYQLGMYVFVEKNICLLRYPAC
jgi:hypothetical protein